MTPQEVYEYYGSTYKFQKMSGMAANTLRNWLIWGRVPENSQYKLEKITNGKLKTDWS